MKWRALLAALLVIVLLLGTVYYVGRLYFAESLYSSRGSLAYWVTISPIIKGVPQVNRQGEAEFYSSAGDGPKLPESAVSYRSSADPAEIRRQIERYLISQGYRARPDGDYDKGISIITVKVEPSENSQLVNVSEVQ